ncbi:hypothetical protein ACFRJ9_07940 [Paenarthrobacter sp. NPDC056912]|uniref:hypothetical protein n=1 Tax=Paenarthrobacter sp. NPDC056912 TaxID=3345965 RepID=UPI0036732022
MANSGITGTGTFWAFPFASAGLYTAGALAEATGDEELAVGDAVVGLVSEGMVPGEAPP